MRRGLRLGGVEGRHRTAEPIAPDEVEAHDRRLLDGIEEEFDGVRGRAGEQLVCHAGCDDCCHGPFPITRLDRRRLRHGMERLEAAEPARARRIRLRARQAIEAMHDGFPGDPASGRPSTDTERLDAFFAGHSRLPCPVLDPQSGRCELYDARPVACRIYGPPTRFRGRDVPSCELCFRDAPSATIDACRLEPDADGLEERLLATLGAAAGEEWETLIAWAVAEP